MSYIYDEALVEKIKGWTSTTKIHVLGVNEVSRMFEIIGDITDDNPIQLPLITLSRGRGFNIINGGTTRRMMSYDAPAYQRNIYNKGTSDAYTTANVINAIPISLTYQLDIFTRYAEEADILVRNLIFNLINYPAFEVEIPTSHTKHIARITLGENVEDTSDVQERFIAGNFTRLTLMLTVEDAYLWDARELHDVTIDIILDDSHDGVKFGNDNERLSLPDPKTLTL